MKDALIKVGIVIALTLILSLVVGRKAHADYLQLTGFAWHEVNHGGHGRYNDRNPGLGYEHTINNDWSISAGFYRNSFEVESQYLLASYQPLHAGNLKFGFATGSVSGYPPGIAGDIKFIPELSYTYKRVGFNLMPLIFPHKSIVAIQFKYQLF